MATVKKEEACVTVRYELKCGWVHCDVVAAKLRRALLDDDGLWDAKDDTNGWDGDTTGALEVTYRSLAHAIRLDPIVRKLASVKVTAKEKADVLRRLC